MDCTPTVRHKNNHGNLYFPGLGDFEAYVLIRLHMRILKQNHLEAM